MGVEKKKLPGGMVEVTFVLPKSSAPLASSVNLVGDFNQWGLDDHPMRRVGGGDFTAVVRLRGGRSYQYRFLLDGFAWENDPDADRYTPTHFGDCDNSVIDL